jgi:hypothetical protein
VSAVRAEAPGDDVAAAAVEDPQAELAAEALRDVERELNETRERRRQLDRVEGKLWATRNRLERVPDTHTRKRVVAHPPGRAATKRVRAKLRGSLVRSIESDGRLTGRMVQLDGTPSAHGEAQAGRL